MGIEAALHPNARVNRPYRNFKEVFGLRKGNTSLRSYMALQDTNLVPPQELMYYSSDLARSESKHPLMGYASAWAAAGAALHKGSVGPEFILDERFRALAFAETMWKRTEKQFEDAGKSAEGARKARLLDLSYRSAEALACLPNMRVVASWNSGSQVDDIYIEWAQLQTNENLLKLMGRLNNDSDASSGKDADDQIARRKNNLMHEIAGIILPQKDTRRQVLVYPAPLQQDHHADPHYRADLIAVDTGMEHNSGLVQVTYAPWASKFPAVTRLFLCTGIDLVEEGHTIDETVEALLASRNGVFDVNKEGSLTNTGARLSDKMLSFIRGTTEAQIPVYAAFPAHR